MLNSRLQDIQQKLNELSEEELMELSSIFAIPRPDNESRWSGFRSIFRSDHKFNRLFVLTYGGIAIGTVVGQLPGTILGGMVGLIYGSYLLFQGCSEDKPEQEKLDGASDE